MVKFILILSAVFLIAACGDKETLTDNDVPDQNDETGVSDAFTYIRNKPIV